MAEVEMQEITLPAESEIKVELTLTSKVNFTSHVAQRRVSKLLLDRVGLLYGERPSLVVNDRLLWRVPIWFSLPTTGPLGQVGTLDVDAQTGEILFNPEILDELRERANALVKRTSPQAS
jgi:hypothetical protein